MLKLSFFLVLIFTVSACKDDNDTIVCTQLEWVGNYEGTVVCDGVSEDGTVTINASGSNAIITIYGAGLTTLGYDIVVSQSSGGGSFMSDAKMAINLTSRYNYFWRC